MKRTISTVMVLAAAMAVPAMAEDRGQLGQIGGAAKRAQQVRELQVTDAEEQQLGASVSERGNTALPAALPGRPEHEER